MTMDVKCQPHLDKVKAYAKSLGEEAEQELQRGLEYLENFRGGECHCELLWDSAPYSFYFNLYGPKKEDGSRPLWFNGGLIYHRAGSSGVGAPEFAVDLDAVFSPEKAAKHRWTVHT